MEVYNWLKAINCERYHEIFVSEGCDSLPALRFLTADDLTEFGVKRIHRRLILDRIQNPPPVDDSPSGKFFVRLPSREFVHCEESGIQRDGKLHS